MGLQDLLKKNQKMGPVIILVVSIVVVGLFVWKVYLPKSQEIDTLTGEIQDVKQQLEQASAKARKRKEVEKAFAKLEAELNNAKEKLPSERETAELLGDLSKMVEKSGMKVTDKKQGESVAPAGDLYKQFTYTFKTEGTFHEMGSFMEGLDSTERLLRVSELKMSNGKIKGREVVIPSQFNIIAYSAVEGKKK